jgi:hypothetical protein
MTATGYIVADQWQIDTTISGSSAQRPAANRYRKQWQIGITTSRKSIPQAVAN